MATKTKMLMSGERYAIVATESGRVVETRFLAPVLDDEGQLKTVRTSIPDGCKAYKAPVGTVGIAKGRIATEVVGLREIIAADDKAAKEAADKRAAAKKDEGAADKAS